MAAAFVAAVPANGLDLSKSARYSIRLDKSVLDDAPERYYTSVRYNYRPLERLQEKTPRIERLESGEGYKLSVTDDNKTYGYSGVRDGSDGCYVLVLQDKGSKKEATLQRVSNAFAFNLTSTPDEADADKLAAQYPQLRLDSDELDTDEEEDHEDEPPDPSNPFDFRHHLKDGAAAPAADVMDLEQPQSRNGTPSLQPRTATNNSISRPSKRPANSALVQPKKRKVAPSLSAEKSASTKRVKAGQESTTATPAISTNKKPLNPPQIRLDRKASLRKPSISTDTNQHDEDDDDSGELILENETPTTERRPLSGRSAMSLALSGEFSSQSQGPISLRSAASTPGSRVQSPLPVRPEDVVDDDGVEEFELGGESEEEEEEPRVRQQRQGERGDREDADADVEDLELPAPAHDRRRSTHGVPPTDDEDDLDAQLAAAMAEADNTLAPPAVNAEDEEESEEE